MDNERSAGLLMCLGAFVTVGVFGVFIVLAVGVIRLSKSIYSQIAPTVEAVDELAAALEREKEHSESFSAEVKKLLSHNELSALILSLHELFREWNELMKECLQGESDVKEAETILKAANSTVEKVVAMPKAFKIFFLYRDLKQKLKLLVLKTEVKFEEIRNKINRIAAARLVSKDKIDNKEKKKFFTMLADADVQISLLKGCVDGCLEFLRTSEEVKKLLHQSEIEDIREACENSNERIDEVNRAIEQYENQGKANNK
mmetsp:Transcript_11864/g.12786  ORF Transcript_11864/g.12786 Transcript_11864/m.12786 type:complete len:259 (-) Transcript_11864:30-806(-)|eukprot:CAMPEP_0173152018 /NCGR_PEP_ID=MMETSP1105-20130129/11958_1 /TAXON_ID=2985 /ORGANISM="Ochromonas sp., Strain BG-1" /LENGTH=258 /DNA_ID=CAMNT_0014067569 /DNA_START=37 /DNA_END=813 /DNA_ORIENTATION=+